MFRTIAAETSYTVFFKTALKQHKSFLEYEATQLHDEAKNHI